ncbi:MAG: hypothetical protein ABFD96_00760 [Armatimonadia bacterium]
MRTVLISVALLVCALGMAYDPGTNITRGIYCPPGPMLTTLHWGKHGDGYEFTNETAHGGKWSIKCVTPDASTAGSGATQTVAVGQTAAAPLRLSGWSRAVNVAEDAKDHRYSLYLDCRYNDGTGLMMQLATFSGGTHDWEYSETIIKPEKPLTSISFYVFLRKRTGTVYFDDLFLGPPDGANLLKNPGFEPEDRNNAAAQEQVYRTYAELNANAIHTYLSGEPTFWLGPDGKGNPQVRDFLRVAASKGIGVWLTTGHPSMPSFKDSSDPNFPQYVCVNGPWGEAWVNTLGLAARYDFAGISLVPDEYNWSNGELKERYAKHPDPKVAEFYKTLPAMCDCGVCQKLYEQAYHEKLPSLSEGMVFPDLSPSYLNYLSYRYDSTTNWLKRGAAAVKQANPAIRTDSLICVTPICSDRWWSVGVAWDRLGETGLDFPTTDPYILLHNYLGDSTHWYVTETAAHLTAATPKRQCGIVLEASRLRGEYRELDPVEIYGSALSAVCHGAKELAWWHYSHITGASPTTERPEVSAACVRGVYGLLKQADPWLGGLQPIKRVAYLHSRASDDFWRFYTEPEPSPVLTHQVNDARYAAVAQKEMLYYLFRRGVPTDLYYLESAQEAQLRDYPVVVVPFPFAIGDAQARLLEKLAEQGKTVLIMSELGTVTETGVPRERPALLGLCGLDAMPVGASATPIIRKVGKGSVVYLPQSAYDLPLHRDNQKKTRSERIIPDPLKRDRVAGLDSLLTKACGNEPWALEALGDKDIEVTCLTNNRKELVVLAINWENEPAECQLRLPRAVAGKLVGFRMGPDGKCESSSLALRSPVLPVQLQPQEACLWRLVK